VIFKTGGTGPEV